MLTQLGPAVRFMGKDEDRAAKRTEYAELYPRSKNLSDTAFDHFVTKEEQTVDFARNEFTEPDSSKKTGRKLTEKGQNLLDTLNKFFGPADVKSHIQELTKLGQPKENSSIRALIAGGGSGTNQLVGKELRRYAADTPVEETQPEESKK